MITVQPVILAGGSGFRLWPASRHDYPKQLLSLVGGHSLLQHTVLRLRGLQDEHLLCAPIVVTNERQRFLVASQLRDIGEADIQVVIEPVGRNTAPAVALAALISDPSEDPVLLVTPSDHLVADCEEFCRAVAQGVALAQENLIVTLGVTPHRPETGYGYIKCGESLTSRPGVRKLACFTEKPTRSVATQFLAEGGYLWNSGIFAARRSTWLRALEWFQPEMIAACRAAVAGARFDGLFIHVDPQAFAACPENSIDYALMEPLTQAAPSETAPDAGLEAAVVPLDAGWSDVGSWEALWEILPKDEQGNVTRGRVLLQDAHGNLVDASSRLVALLGTEDLVVIETADAILVSAKDQAHDMKRLVSYVQQADEQLVISHREVHRPWGSFDQLARGNGFQVKRIKVLPGARISLQFHRHRAEHWVVVRGTAEVICEDEVRHLREGEATYIPAGVPHRVSNPGPELLEIIETQTGSYLGEDDIVRLEDRYGRVEPAVRTEKES